MNPLINDPEQVNALRQEALARAEALRKEAMDDVWRGANAALASAATLARRAAARLSYRLERHQALRRLG